MLFALFGWEFFIETVPQTQKFLDCDFSACENHVWFGPLHVVWNRIGENHNDAHDEPIEGPQEIA